MNASLDILLILFLSTCHGKEQDDSPPSGILPTTKWQKKVETPLEISCPDPTDIEPCECSNSLGDLVMDCSNVQDKEELRKVFSAFFPTTNFYRLIMQYNHGVKILEDGVFGNVSFQVVHIYYSVLETVETDAFTPSLSTLAQISILRCMLEIFPFERLTEFTALQDLELPGNKLQIIPPLSSSSIKVVALNENFITHITPDVFTLLPAVVEILLDNNHLKEIPKGTFTGIPKLQHVDLSRNNINYLCSLTFGLFSYPFSNALHLDNNNIEYVEVDAFEGVPGPATIYMDNNALVRLPEDVWRPLLEKGIHVSLSGNDLVCGCDVAWLVTDSQLQTMVSDVRCADGTWLTALSPADFDICG